MVVFSRLLFIAPAVSGLSFLSNKNKCPENLEKSLASACVSIMVQDLQNAWATTGGSASAAVEDKMFRVAVEREQASFYMTAGLRMELDKAGGTFQAFESTDKIGKSDKFTVLEHVTDGGPGSCAYPDGGTLHKRLNADIKFTHGTPADKMMEVTASDYSCHYDVTINVDLFCPEKVKKKLAKC